MRYVIIAITLLGYAGCAGATSEETIRGLWFTKGERARIEVTPCGERVCGHIVWLKQPNGDDGKPLVDSLNERDDERGRPILGLPVLVDLNAASDGSFVGEVYDPERGEYFDVTVRLNGSPDSLAVEGCGLGGLICETEVWRRAPPAP